jgi:hypothetical protein
MKERQATGRKTGRVNTKIEMEEKRKKGTEKDMKKGGRRRKGS